MNFTTSDIKKIRELTGAGMLDCKKALVKADGVKDKAIDWLRQKGLSTAAKKAGRIAAEGCISSYIHGKGRIGVLLEVNCETDFVAKNEDFQAFVSDISMHIAAMAPEFISTVQITKEAKDKEKAILKAKAIEEGKRPEFLDKILEGQIKKWATSICLLDQPFVKNPDMTIQEHLRNIIVKIGENIVIRRFVRFELGEGIEKKVDNFAKEVAQMTG